MATIGEAILAALGGDVGPAVEVSPRTAALGLVAAAGSVSAAARDLGVPRSTFRRWLAGSTPRDGGGALVEQAREAWRELQATADRWTHGPGDLDGLRVVGTFSYAGGSAEERDIALGPYIATGTARDLLDAYQDGADAEELGSILAASINDPSGFYARTFDPFDGFGDWDVHEIHGWP